METAGDPVGTHQMAKDQTRLAISGKLKLGTFDIGLTSFGSGAIQMDGQNAGTSTLVPSGDVKINTQAIVARYAVNDNFSVSAGLREVSLKSSTLTSVKTDYAVNSASKTGMVYGISYEIPEIALRAELLQSEAMIMGLSGTAAGGQLPLTDSTLGVPEATTIKFQTGIAEDTLIMASAHKVKWSSSQVDVKVAGYIDSNGVNPSTFLDQPSAFSDSIMYSLGLGRKLTESTSASLNYSWEKGSGSTSTSPFTMSNGSKTLSLGVQHKIEALTISGGLSYTKTGDVVTSSAPFSASYTGNSVTALGLKVGYNF